MKFSVNLLQETQRAATRTRRLGILLQSISLGILIGFSAITLMIISYSVVISAQRNKLKTQIDSLKTQIEGMKAIEVKQQLVKRKIKLISQIITEYGIDYKIATDLFRFAANKITFGRLVFSDTSEQIFLGGTADNVNDFTYFVEELTSYAKENNFQKVEIGEFARNSEGKYNFEITITAYSE